MRIGRQLCGLIVVMAIGASAAIAQTLNPTVTLLPEPTGSVPSDCVDPAAKPVQRAAVEPEPQPARPVPSPQPTTVVAPVTTVEDRDVRLALRSAHAAAIARDRATYDAALAAAKALVPSGGSERELANDVLALFADLTRLWDYQLTAPIGSFFDSSVQAGSLLRMLSARPGYEDFVRRQIIVDSTGARFYPTRESMDFLLGLIATRLGRGGVTVARQTEEPRSVVRQPPAPSPQPRVTPVPQPEPQPRTTQRTGTTTRKSASRPRSTARRDTPTPQPSSRPRRPAPAPAPQPVAVATPEEPALPPGVVAATPSETSAATETTTTTVEPVAIDTALTTDTVAATDTTTTQSAPAQQPQRRSIILPIVLILIGVGVLIILFRASS